MHLIKLTVNNKFSYLLGITKLTSSMASSPIRYTSRLAGGNGLFFIIILKKTWGKLVFFIRVFKFGSQKINFRFNNYTGKLSQNKA